MPKSPKPTPAQARVLRSLAKVVPTEERRWYNPAPCIFITLRERDGVETVWKASGQHLDGVHCSTTTGRVLYERGWITRKDGSTSKYGGTFILSDEGHAALEGLKEKDFISPPTKKPVFSTADIKDALVKKYEAINQANNPNSYRGSTSQKWIYFFEVPSRAYYGSSRIDFWAMACWGSLNYESISYEIKISRGDFLNEIKKPEKRKFGMDLSNQFYFVTGPALLSIDEIPEGCGLMELWQDGKFHIIKKAPKRERLFKPTWDFVATIGRRALVAWERGDFAED